LQYVDQFGLRQAPAHLDYLRAREDDYYISLVGELFARLDGPYEDNDDWSRLGNAITQFGTANSFNGAVEAPASLPRDTALFAAAAFYLGGFPASAYLTLLSGGSEGVTEGHLAAYELLARPQNLDSPRVRGLIGAVRRGDLEALEGEVDRAREHERAALDDGPEEWIGWRLFGRMASRFAETNVRTVLPAEADEFWDPLIRSLLNRTPPVWDFFPSQIDAIQRGLLEASESFSLQMPTGSGKTALTETLLFSHLRRRPTEAAVLLVPYRALAAELRGSLVRRLNGMGLNARSAYGGTVPPSDEIQELGEVRILVATPETLSGFLSADQDFFRRISLVICDEGHLLDGRARGVSLELLLSRLRAREVGAPRFVFVSAIVPNIEEINAWLGGTSDTVVRSDYRPALAEFARLDVRGTGVRLMGDLRLHPHEGGAGAFDIQRFLSQDDFRYRNPETGRLKTYGFDTVKTQAIASARKAFSMGSVAVFAANKRGNQGSVGLAEELLSQLESPTSLPIPLQFVRDATALQAASEYFVLEYGSEWVGTRALEAGAVLHHGDVPQESREVVERLLRERVVPLAICTSTLAEGVNLPIRTLVLYSVQRRGPDGAAENLLARDIKNLVGRAGRAGTTTKGLVICANARQWGLIEPVARQEPGEPVVGALLTLMDRVRRALRQQSLTLTNPLLEDSAELHTLIDGVDATLIDLAAEELGEDELVQIAGDLSAETYAASQATTETTLLMREVFELRARRVFAIRAAGRLEWIRETGTRARMLESVETGLLPQRERWDDIEDPADPGLIDALLAWAWELPDVQEAVSQAYRDVVPEREGFRRLVESWIGGKSLIEMAQASELAIDDMLAIHARVITYELHAAVEQGVALLRKFCEAEQRSVSSAVLEFPEHLRFGVPTRAARMIASLVRHRRAAVALGQTDELANRADEDRDDVIAIAKELILDRERWLQTLGRLVLENTVEDLGALPSADGE
jgi:superfamily II DNA/RNA helicase